MLHGDFKGKLVSYKASFGVFKAQYRGDWIVSKTCQPPVCNASAAKYQGCFEIRNNHNDNVFHSYVSHSSAHVSN